MCWSVPQMPARRTRIRTSDGPMRGRATSSRESPGAALSLRKARIDAGSRVGAVGAVSPASMRPDFAAAAAPPLRPSGLAVPSGDVVLGALVLRPGEDL